jgi:hypothetical protein
MKKKNIIIVIASLMLVASGWWTYNWTNADSAKTFQGDVVSLDDTSVTVKRGRKELPFERELLAEKDQEWAKEEEEEAKVATAAKEKEKIAAEFAESDFGKSLEKLQKLEDTKFVDHKLQEAPKYFLLYFSASW